MAQRMAVVFLRQQFEKCAEIFFVEFLVRRELPEQGAELGAELGDAGIEKAIDGVAGLGQHAAIDGVARTFERENESVRHFGGPFAEGLR